jgi:transposase InsO family protein
VLFHEGIQRVAISDINPDTSSPEARKRREGIGRLVRRKQPSQCRLNGAQYLSIRYSECVTEAGVEVSVGSNGDAYDNAMAESVIGLFKTEVIRKRFGNTGQWRGLDDVEYATLEWVSWFNTCHLLEPLGYLPPAAYEAQFQERCQELQVATGAAGALK